MRYVICKISSCLIDNTIKDLYFLISVSKLQIIYSHSRCRYLNGVASENIKVLDFENGFKRVEYIEEDQCFLLCFSDSNYEEYKSIPNIAEILKDVSEEEAKLYFELNYK